MTTKRKVILISIGILVFCGVMCCVAGILNTQETETIAPVTNPTGTATQVPIPSMTPTRTIVPTATVAPCKYIGNSNTMKFHYAGCSWVGEMEEGHKVCLPTREEAVARGYAPCKKCNP